MIQMKEIKLHEVLKLLLLVNCALVYIYFLIEVELIYNIVLVSGVQQSDSVFYIYIFFFSGYFPL